MSKKKNGGRRPNSAKPKSAAPAKPATPKHNPRKGGSARKGSSPRKSTKARRRNGASALRHLNPRLPGGLRLTSLAAAGGGAIVAQVLSNVIPFGAPGSWLSLAKQLGVVALVAKFWPRKLEKESAVAGAAAVPVVTLVNKLVPGFQDKLVSLFPSFTFGTQPAPQQQGAQGLVDFNPRYLPQGMQGLVAVTPDSSLFRYVS